MSVSERLPVFIVFVAETVVLPIDHRRPSIGLSGLASLGGRRVISANCRSAPSLAGY